MVIKVTRDPAYSSRLLNERRALQMLERAVVTATIPRPLFAGFHRGLAVVGETAVDGSPFAKLSDGSPTCPHLRSAIEFAHELGEVRTGGREASPSQLEPALVHLAGLFRGLCRPSPHVIRQLELDVAALLADPPPTVFLHGDLGIWNILVDDAGRVAVLDWENADPLGLPCWDLAQLVLAQGSAALTARGRRLTGATMLELLRPDEPWGELLSTECTRSATRLGFNPGNVAPLLRLGQVLAAVKVSTRRSPSDASHSIPAELLSLVAKSPGRTII